LVLGRAASIRTVVLGVGVDVCEVVLCYLAVVSRAIAAGGLNIDIAVFLAALIVVVIVHVLSSTALGDIAGAVAGG